MSVERIIKADKEGKVIFGFASVKKALRKGALKEVVLASNCPDSIQQELTSVAVMSNTKISLLDINAEELATQCKKNFNFSVAGIKGD